MMTHRNDSNCIDALSKAKRQPSRALKRRRQQKQDGHSYEKLEPRAMLNGSPVAMPDYGFHTDLNTTLTISSSDDGVLGNDFDAENSFTAVKVSDPNNGTLTLNSDGTFTYVPDTGYQGIDSFRYKVDDGTNFSRTKPVQIRVGDGLSAKLNDDERTDNGFLHSGSLALEQPIGSGLSLSYRSDTIPIALVPVETFITPGTTLPNSVTANLTIDGVSSGDVTFNGTSLTTGDPLRFVLRALTPTSSTGMHDWTMSVKLNYTGSTVTQNFTGSSALVNRVGTEFGTGWWLNGLDRLYTQTDGALLVNGDGTTLWFEKSGSTYFRADGDLTFSTLVDTGTEFELTDKWGNEQVFDSNGYITSTKSVNNSSDSLTFTYDTSDRIEKITDEFSREFTFTYNSTTGKLDSVNDFAGRDSTMTFTGDLLTSVTLADETETGYTAPDWTYAYTTIGGKDYLDSVTDPDGQETEYVYNTASRKIKQINHVADSSHWKLFPALTEGFAYGTGNDVHKVADSNPRFVNERGYTFKFQTDRYGNITYFEKPEGGATEFDFDDSSMLYQITEADPDGAGSLEAPVTKFGNTLVGDVRTIVNPDDTEIKFAYDSTLHLVETITNELNEVETFDYDLSGNLTSYIDAENNEWTYTYNSRGNLLTEVTPDPDALGSLSSITTTYEYETTINSRLKKITWGDTAANDRSFTYTTSDQVATVTDELGRVTEYEYDPLDRITKLTLPDPDGGTSNPEYAYEYDANLQLKKLTDPLGSVTEYKYNDRHWLTEIILPDPDGATTTLSSPKFEYSYDVSGNLTSEIRPEFKTGTSTTYTYDKNNRLTETSGPVTDQDYEYVYDDLDRLTQVTDPSGRIIQSKYDIRSRLTDVIDHGSSNPTTSFTYDDAGRMKTVTDELGRVTSYDYFKTGWLKKTTMPDPDGTGDLTAPTYTNDYDALGRLTKITDPSGRFESYTYDERHRMTEMTGKDPDDTGALTALTTEYTYDAASRLTSLIEAKGDASLERTTSYAYDDLDRLTTVTLPDPDGAGGASSPVYSYEYDHVGNRTKSTDALGRDTTFVYDDMHRQIEVTLPDVDAAGPKESVWSFEYNNDALLSKVTDPEGLTAERSYDDAGRLDTFTNNSGNDTTFTYDTLDRLKTITSPDPDGVGAGTSSVTTYNYDLRSRLTSIVDAASGTTSQSYDDAGQLLSLTDPEGNTTRWAYDDLGRMTMETDERGYTRSFNHNSVGRLVRVQDRNGNITRYVNEGYTTYERWYSNSSVPASEISTTTEGSTGTNEVQSITLSNMGVDDFFRLAFNGEVTAPIQGDAVAADIESALEALDGIGSVVVTGGSGSFSVEFNGGLAGTNVSELMSDAIADNEGTPFRAITFDFDPFYRLTGTADTSGGTYSFDYDDLDRVIGQTESPSWTSIDIDLDFGYDAVGNRTSLAATVGSNLDYENTYSYNKQDRLTVLQQSGQSGGNSVADKRTVFSYDDLGRVTHINRYEATSNTNPAIRSVYSWDGTTGLLSTLQHREVDGSGGTSLLHKYTYSYDDMDRITSINSTVDGVSDYTHDELSRLTDADHAVARPDESFTYDDTGNRTGGGYTVGDDNLTSSDGTYDYEYDKEGNRTKRTKISSGDYDEYTWDHRNRLTSIVTKTSSNFEIASLNYEYDVFNRLTKRVYDSNGGGSPGGVETQYFAGFDGLNATLEFDGTTQNDISHRYLWIGDQLFAHEQVGSISTAGDVLWGLADQVGTIRDIVEFDSGTSKFAVTNHRVYDSFGNLTSETDATVDLDFGFTSRWTDEATGMTNHLYRWYDPSVGKWLSDDPIGFAGGFANLQSYVGNQVLELTDFYGLTPYQELEEGANQGADGSSDWTFSVAGRTFYWNPFNKNASWNPFRSYPGDAVQAGVGVLGGLATNGRFNFGEDAIIVGEAGTKGLGTGAKATYNASGDTLIGFATLGNRDMEAFGMRVHPTEEEVQLGYYYAEGFSRGGQELGFAVLTGGMSRASSVGQAALVLDTAGNINGVKRNGDKGNYLAAAGHGAGLGGNAAGSLQRMRIDKFRAVPLNEVIAPRNVPTTISEVNLKGLIQGYGKSLAKEGKFFGWGPSKITKSLSDFTEDGLLKAGWTKERLAQVAEAYEHIARITPSNPSAAGRAAQFRALIEKFF